MRTVTPFLVALVALLGACATPRQLDNDVSTYSQWPAGRKPASYAFERLPSQQARAELQQQLEDAARGAIEAAGFAAAPDEAQAEVGIQVGVRTSALARAVFDDPFWWRGGVSTRWRRGFYSSAGIHYTTPIYEREVALLIRDRKSGQTLYEARASNATGSGADATVLAAMFEAAMKDFPNTAINPRRVTVELNR
ncbi:MAG: DUF4136 domain-containing protein [Burkholderiaceae bacterium]